MAARDPRVFTVPAEVPFLDALARGLIARHYDPGAPLAFADVTVFLPTRRAKRALADHLVETARAGGLASTLALPQIKALGDVDEDALVLTEEGEAGLPGDPLALPPALPAWRRRFLLVRLVLQWSATRDAEHAASAAQALALARDLERFLDRVDTYGVDLARLPGLVGGDLAHHWQDTVDFLAILTKAWPAVLAAAGGIGPAVRRAGLAAALVRQWAEEPPRGPVYAAGSTGSAPATAELLGAIARLPQGQILLPGLDLDLDDAAWRAVDESHPQGALKALLARLGLARADVAVWPHVRAGGPGARARLLNDALRPWEETAVWRDFGREGDVALALARLDAPSEAVEAQAIALILRETLRWPGRTAALVTPDRRLARAVRERLKRWAIEVDDSAGMPLAATPPAAFLRHVAAAVADGLTPVSLLALLKHPLAAAGLAPAACRRAARHLEMRLLRGLPPAPGLAGLRARLARRDAADQARLAPFLDRLERALAPILALMDARGPVSFARLLECHVAAAEALAATDTQAGASRLWAGEAGEALAIHLAEIAEEEAYAPHRPATEYPGYFDQLLGIAVIRPRAPRHPRLHIWGPLEARLQAVDVAVLGGLNEGTWPRASEPDPWLSRAMTRDLGLPPPEERLGLSAHDFVQTAAAAGMTYLTRAVKVDGEPTVASRWLARLDAVTQGARYGLKPADPWLSWAELLDRPEGPPRAAAEPAPAPGPDFRPAQLSVSDVRQWLRDPYAIYAKHILGLRPLLPLGQMPDAAIRGQVAHAIAKAFLDTGLDPGAPEARAALDLIIERTLDAWGIEAGRRAFWRPRLDQSFARFLALESQWRQAGQVPIGGEIRGTLTFDGLARPFTLIARADRIDRTADGSLIITDFKTGRSPSKRQMTVGVEPQLPLEAAIAGAGGFETVPAAPVQALRIVRLMTGDHDKATETTVDVGTLAADAQAGLLAQVARYDQPRMAYRSRVLMQYARDREDYDHLARVKEWSAGGEDGEA